MTCLRSSDFLLPTPQYSANAHHLMKVFRQLLHGKFSFEISAPNRGCCWKSLKYRMASEPDDVRIARINEFFQIVRSLVVLPNRRRWKNIRPLARPLASSGTSSPRRMRSASARSPVCACRLASAPINGEAATRSPLSYAATASFRIPFWP